MSEETHGIPEIDDGLEDLDGLKELLAEEGVAGDDDWSPEDLLEEADADEDDSSPVDHSSSKRSKRRGGRDRHRDDEQAFRDLDSQLTAETLELKIDEDHLIVTVGRLGQENTIEEVRDELRRHKILAELDEKTVTVALQRAASGRPQYDVVAARGTPAIVHTHSHLRFHLPDALTVDDPQPLAALQQAVGGPSLDVVEAWEGPVHVVHAGDVMVDIAAAEYEEGCDVYGQPILPEVDELPPLPHGDYTKLTADGQAVVATHYGYGGVIGNEPTVVSPIFVSSDSMEVHFVVIKGEAMPAPTPEELKAVLEVRWVEKGIDDEAIHRLCQELDTGKALQKRSHLVAQGIPPSPGVDGEIKYDTAPSSLVRWKDLDSLRKARDQDELVVAVGEMQGSGRALIAVHAGDELATRKPAIEGLPGSDIRGEELPAEEGENVELDAGLNTEVDAEGVVLKATQFGLVAVYGSEQLSVVPPVWIATDKQSLCFLNLHQGEQPVLPTAAELSESIETDVDLSAWDGIRSQLEAGELTDPIIPIIQGTVPVPGEDGRFEWAIKVGGRAGKILDDGSIDLRDRRLITVAQPGDLLGSSYVAKPGSPGVDVFGAELSPPPACDIEVVCDARIEARPQDEGRIDYHAVEQGGVTFTEESRRKRGIPVRRLRLSLFAVSEISGDVDYSTGHVDFRGDVVIGGSVKPLFRVKATGSVTIGGNVEPGAYIEAGGDVAVGGGIMGDRTVIQAGSGVQAKFIEQARVTCGGDVEVGSHLLEASVRSSGSILVAGKGGKGARALVGGIVWAAGDVETPSLGSPSNPHLKVVVGVDPAGVRETEKLRANQRACEARQRELLASVGVPHVDVARMKRLIKNSTDEDARSALVSQMKTLVDLGLLRRDLRRRIDELATAQRERASHHELRVPGDIFTGPQLRIGEHVLSLEADDAKKRYRLTTDEDDRSVIEVDDL